MRPGVTLQAAQDDLVRVAGRPADAPAIQINDRSVSADYFTALGIARVRGRGFTEPDVWERGQVVMINQAAARRF